MLFCPTVCLLAVTLVRKEPKLHCRTFPLFIFPTIKPKNQTIRNTRTVHMIPLLQHHKVRMDFSHGTPWQFLLSVLLMDINELIWLIVISSVKQTGTVWVFSKLNFNEVSWHSSNRRQLLQKLSGHWTVKKHFIIYQHVKKSTCNIP